MNLLARWASVAGLGLALVGVAGCGGETSNEKEAQITSTPSSGPAPSYEDFNKKQMELQKNAYGKGSGYPKGGMSGS